MSTICHNFINQSDCNDFVLYYFSNQYIWNLFPEKSREKVGEAFFNDSFHSGIRHEDILKNIKCKTVFMKAQTNINEDGILTAALSEDDLERAADLIGDCQIVRFDCGHGIHIENPKKFIECMSALRSSK